MGSPEFVPSSAELTLFLLLQFSIAPGLADLLLLAANTVGSLEQGSSYPAYGLQSILADRVALTLQTGEVSKQNTDLTLIADLWPAWALSCRKRQAGDSFAFLWVPLQIEPSRNSRSLRRLQKKLEKIAIPIFSEFYEKQDGTGLNGDATPASNWIQRQWANGTGWNALPKYWSLFVEMTDGPKKI